MQCLRFVCYAQCSNSFCNECHFRVFWATVSHDASFVNSFPWVDAAVQVCRRPLRISWRVPCCFVDIPRFHRIASFVLLSSLWLTILLAWRQNALRCWISLCSILSADIIDLAWCVARCGNSIHGSSSLSSCSFADVEAMSQNAVLLPTSWQLSSCVSWLTSRFSVHCLVLPSSFSISLSCASVLVLCVCACGCPVACLVVVGSLFDMSFANLLVSDACDNVHRRVSIGMCDLSHGPAYVPAKAR